MDSCGADASTSTAQLFVGEIFPHHLREIAKCRRIGYAVPMPSILDQIQEYPGRRYERGEVVAEQGATSGKLFFLAEGSVEIIKDGMQITIVREPGAVFGEMSIFRQVPHAATVRAHESSVLHIVEDARRVLENNPALCFYVCGIMANRLDALIGFLANAKQQYAGQEPLWMVEGALESLMRRQPRKRIRPDDSTIRKGEVAD